MEKKEPIKVSLPVFIAIVVLFVALIFGVYMYMQNQKLDKEIANLREDISKSQKEKNELQEQLNRFSNTTNNSELETITEDTQTNTESSNNNEKIEVKQKEEDSDTVATLYSNNKVTIKLRDNQMWKYNVEDWKTAEYDKEYNVEGIKNEEISKIFLTNLPAGDVVPALIILSKNGTISYVDISLELHNAFEKKTAIDSFTAKEKKTNIKNIIDIKNKTGDMIVAIDNNGKEYTIWQFKGVD